MEQLEFNEMVDITTTNTSEIIALTADEITKESTMPDTTGITLLPTKKISRKRINNNKAQSEIYRLQSNQVAEAIRNGWIHNGNLRNPIGWTDETANCITGCSYYSESCKNCYSKRQTPWLKICHPVKYRNGFDVTLHPHLIAKDTKWGRKVQYIFWNSMSDTFHKLVPDEYIFKMFEFFNNTPEYTFQIVTKRAERLAQLAPYIDWTPNIWCGVTVEMDKYSFRADLLRQVPADIKMISAEPLLSPLPSLNLDGISLIMSQSESGPANLIRPSKVEWVRELRDKCIDSGTCFYFKGWGGPDKDASGDLLDGKTWKQLPILRKDLDCNPFES